MVDFEFITSATTTFISIQIGQKIYTEIEGYFKFPVDPGFEIQFLRSLTKNTKIGTGFNFQKGRVSSNTFGVMRFHFEELSVPIILQTVLNIKESDNRYFITAGIYGGKTLLQMAESPNSSDSWLDITRSDQFQKYSNDEYFIDVYFDAGYTISLAKLGDYSLAPFFKYRVNSTWLNTYQEKAHWGIKFIYSFKF